MHFFFIFWSIYGDLKRSMGFTRKLIHTHLDGCSIGPPELSEQKTLLALLPDSRLQKAGDYNQWLSALPLHLSLER